MPPPRFHLVRYHGVFAANTTERAEVVPNKPEKRGSQLPLFAPGQAGHLEPPPEPSRHPCRIALLARGALRRDPIAVGERGQTVADDLHRAEEALLRAGRARGAPLGGLPVQPLGEEVFR